MGFNQMAELTHKMEDVLSKFRDGQLSVNQDVVTVLFQCLDTLESMVNNIQSEDNQEIDIQSVINGLEAIVSNKPIESVQAKEVEKAVVSSNDTVPDRIALNEYDINVLKEAKYRGYNAYEIRIILSENTLLKSARAFLVFKNLEESGEIIKSNPSAEDLENENFDLEIRLVYVTTKVSNNIYESIMSISEIDKVDVWDLDVEKYIAKKERDRSCSTKG